MALARYFAFTENIVAQMEFRHQLHVIESSRSRRIWIILALVMLVPALIGSLVFFGSALLSPFAAVNLLPREVNNALAYSVFLLMIVMNVALYAVVHLITIGLSANSITREKQGRTWENLLLTNVDARQIVWGKWWATVRVLWDDHLLVALLRFGLIAWVVTRFVSEPESSGAFVLLNTATLAHPIRFVHLLLLAGLATVYTMLDAAFSAALGVFAPLPGWSGAVTMALVLSARVLATLVGVVWAAQVFNALIAQPGAFTYLLVAAAGLLALVAAIWGALRLAQIVAVRGQVSPPERAG